MFKKIWDGLKSAYQWTVAKGQAVYAWATSEKTQQKARKVVAKAKEMALCIHRALVNAFYRGAMVAYAMNGECRNGGSSLVQAFRKALSTVKGMSDAEVAHAITMIRTDYAVESAPAAQAVAA